MTDNSDYELIRWDIRKRAGGTLTDPRSVRVGDLVTVTGTGRCCGVDGDYFDVPGVVESHDGRAFTVRVQAWKVLPAGFWHDPRVTFGENLVRSVTKYPN